jgi:thiamine-phosphate pyrophosphorylase
LNTRLAPRLIVFSDTSRAGPELMLTRFAALARHAEPGTVLFTLRDYGLSVAARLSLGVQLRDLVTSSGQAFGVADRVDLARALEARAVHLPEAGLAELEVRRLLGPDIFVSRACHESQPAAEPSADALLLSPIFEARKGRAALGLSALQRLCRADLRGRAAPAVYGLGAVDAGNAASCMAAGAAGVAVIGAALAVDPAPLLEALEISRR